jgi:hypothetical protein
MALGWREVRCEVGQILVPRPKRFSLFILFFIFCFVFPLSLEFKIQTYNVVKLPQIKGTILLILLFYLFIYLSIHFLLFLHL